MTIAKQRGPHRKGPVVAYSQPAPAASKDSLWQNSSRQLRRQSSTETMLPVQLLQAMLQNSLMLNVPRRELIRRAPKTPTPPASVGVAIPAYNDPRTISMSTRKGTTPDSDRSFFPERYALPFRSRRFINDHPQKNHSRKSSNHK